MAGSGVGRGGAEVNLLRTDPAGYADKLEALVPYYEGKMYSPPGAPQARPTTEGVVALQRAIDYLRGSDVKPVGALTLAPGLDLAAQDSANNMRYSAGMGSPRPLQVAAPRPRLCPG